MAVASRRFNLLHVRKAAATGADSHTDDVFVLENNGHIGMNIISSTTTTGFINFSDDTRARGIISYDHSTDAMLIRTAGANAMTISAAGAVAIPYVWNTALTGTAVMITSTGILTKNTSSQRYKRNIRGMDDSYGAEFIMALRPVTTRRVGFCGG